MPLSRIDRGTYAASGDNQSSMPPRVKRERLIPEVKQERSAPQVRERRRQKSRGRAGVTPKAKLPEFELQESGSIRRGALLTREGDKRDEIDVLRII